MGRLLLVFVSLLALLLAIGNLLALLRLQVYGFLHDVTGEHDSLLALLYPGGTGPHGNIPKPNGPYNILTLPKLDLVELDRGQAERQPIRNTPRNLGRVYGAQSIFDNKGSDLLHLLHQVLGNCLVVASELGVFFEVVAPLVLDVVTDPDIVVYLL